jgi:hypothetical protein
MTMHVAVGLLWPIALILRAWNRNGSRSWPFI